MDGYDTVVYEITYVNGEEVSRDEVSRVITDPIPEIIRVGTQVTEVKEETVRENVVDYSTQKQEDDTLLEGETEVIQEGVDGYDRVVYNVTYVNGVETKRSDLRRETVAPREEIIAIGIKVDTEGVETLEEMINSLPEEITLEHQTIVSDVRLAYEELTVRQKELVKNLKRLENAEARINTLENSYRLTIQVRPIEGGSIKGIGDYEANTQIQLEAIPDEGFVFKNWLMNGEVVSEETNFIYTMPDQDIEITASFQSISEPYLSFNAYTGTITDYNIEGGRDVYIPSSIEGIEVSNIGDQAFDNKYLRSVVIPETIKTIGFSAFANNYLREVEIPNSVTMMGYGAFQNNIITDLKISENIQNVSGALFYNNNLTSVTIPAKVREIENIAFSNNELIDVRLSEGLEVIGAAAFIDNNLNEIEIPNGVTHINYNAFANNQLTSLNIPDSVKAIEGVAFRNNNLNSIEIPSSVASIGAGAFSLNNLKTVILNEGLFEIKEDAFFRNNIIEIELPKSLVVIGNQALAENNVSKITLGPDTIIDNNLFGSNSNSLRKVYYDDIHGGEGTYIKIHIEDEIWERQ